MKPKKKEKLKLSQQTEESNEADLEKFTQAFEKPTKIYRYLRTRHIVSPIFLTRSLYYMQQRRSVSNAKRKSFKVDSLLAKKKVTVKQEVLENSVKYLKLEFVGFYDKEVPKYTTHVEVEAIVTKIHQKRKDEGSPHMKQTSLGTVTVPVNPSENQSSLDGTQSAGSPACRATIVSQEGFDFSSRKSVQSYVLHLSVTCRLSHPHLNGVCTDEPQPKKRRSAMNGCSSVEEEEDVVVYGAELSVIGRHSQCMLQDGDYDLLLQELGSKFSSRRDSMWERAHRNKPIEPIEVFDCCPLLKFKLSWTDDMEGNQPCKVSPSEFLSNNQYSNEIRFSGFDMDNSPLKLKEETQSTPQKRIQIIYQFLYNDNTRQQTDTRDSFHCPWCAINCEKLYSLLKHLRLSHARFNFIYVPHPKGARIDVSVNDSYDGSYAGNPQDLNSHIGFAFSRLGPVRRTSITHVIVYRPKRPVPSLLEFYEPEKENQVCRQIIQGHNRLYYRTNTCLPLKPHEVDEDSEDEVTPLWLQQKSINLIDEFTDVNEGEKELMKLWNLHCMKYAYISDCQIPAACSTFVEEQGRTIMERHLEKNFLVHLVNMFDFSLLSPDNVQRTMWQLYTMKEDLELSAP